MLEALRRFPEAITDYQAVSAAVSGPCSSQPLQLYRARDAAGGLLKDKGLSAMPLAVCRSGSSSNHCTGPCAAQGTSTCSAAQRAEAILASTSPCAFYLLFGHSGAGEAASGSSSLEQPGKRHSRWGQQTCPPSLPLECPAVHRTAMGKLCIANLVGCGCRAGELEGGSGILWQSRLAGARIRICR